MQNLFALNAAKTAEVTTRRPKCECGGLWDLMLKMDYYMPTLSFKDRGAAVLIAHCKAIGVDSIVAACLIYMRPQTIEQR